MELFCCTLIYFENCNFISTFDLFLEEFLLLLTSIQQLLRKCSLVGIGHAIFEGRVNLSRPLTLLDLLEMGIPADVVKALVDNLEIKAISRQEGQDVGIEVQQMVVAALASLQRIVSDVNGLSMAIDDVNRRHAHLESVLKAGGRIVGPTVECGQLNTKPMVMASNKTLDAGSQNDILGHSDGCLSGSKQEHTELAASDLFNSPILQNSGGIYLVESLRMLEVPSQPESKTVVSCSCSCYSGMGEGVMDPSVGCGCSPDGMY